MKKNTHEVKVMASDVRRAYNYSGNENATCLDFLIEWTGGQKIYVDNTVGLVRSERVMTANDVANYWSDKIFQSSDELDYSAKNPFAKSRLLYVLLTIQDFIKKQNKSTINSICDFATGEGYFLEHCRQYAPDLKLLGTETSSELVSLLNKKGFDVKEATLGNNQLSISTDLGVISWTLCNCIDVIKVLMEIRNSINDNGFICVADSSRIMVPFRKSLKDYFSTWHPLDIHPFYFSYRSLVAALKISGFKLLFSNRYFDSDVICLIAQKTVLPDDNEIIEVDSSASVIDFMKNWHTQSKIFESYR
jgi:hypothetical protein